LHDDHRSPTPGGNDDDRFAAMTAAIAARLRPVCANWPESLFNEMVDGLARITIKYEGEVTPGPHDASETEKLVSDLKAALDRSRALRESLGQAGADQPS
jgi:hypothetical protein